MRDVSLCGRPSAGFRPSALQTLSWAVGGCLPAGKPRATAGLGGQWGASSQASRSAQSSEPTGAGSAGPRALGPRPRPGREPGRRSAASRRSLAGAARPLPPRRTIGRGHRGPRAESPLTSRGLRRRRPRPTRSPRLRGAAAGPGGGWCAARRGLPAAWAAAPTPRPRPSRQPGAADPRSGRGAIGPGETPRAARAQRPWAP